LQGDVIFESVLKPINDHHLTKCPDFLGLPQY
jgi:hypothetical protein